MVHKLAYIHLSTFIIGSSLGTMFTFSMQWRCDQEICRWLTMTIILRHWRPHTFESISNKSGNVLRKEMEIGTDICGVFYNFGLSGDSTILSRTSRLVPYWVGLHSFGPWPLLSQSKIVTMPFKMWPNPRLKLGVIYIISWSWVSHGCGPWPRQKTLTI